MRLISPELGLRETTATSQPASIGQAVVTPHHVIAQLLTVPVIQQALSGPTQGLNASSASSALVVASSLNMEHKPGPMVTASSLTCLVSSGSLT